MKRSQRRARLLCLKKKDATSFVIANGLMRSSVLAHGLSIWTSWMKIRLITSPMTICLMEALVNKISMQRLRLLESSCQRSAQKASQRVTSSFASFKTTTCTLIAVYLVATIARKSESLGPNSSAWSGSTRSKATSRSTNTILKTVPLRFKKMPNDTPRWLESLKRTAASGARFTS